MSEVVNRGSGRLDDAALDHLKHHLIGTCLSLDEALENLGLAVSIEIAEDHLLDGAVSMERCSGCEWWLESNQLEYDEARGSGCCEQCRDAEHG